VTPAIHLLGAYSMIAHMAEKEPKPIKNKAALSTTKSVSSSLSRLFCFCDIGTSYSSLPLWSTVVKVSRFSKSSRLSQRPIVWQEHLQVLRRSRKPERLTAALTVPATLLDARFHGDKKPHPLKCGFCISDIGTSHSMLSPSKSASKASTK
jgi:hypothetical protein